MNDRIEKSIELKAPPSRVWRAVTDSKEFGEWFGVALDSQFAPGKTVEGQLTIPNYEHVKWHSVVQKMEPERLFSFTWHPYSPDSDPEYLEEEPTLVTFELEPLGTGTRLRITESGFDKIPAKRREEAFMRNDNGWDVQIKCVGDYVDSPTS